MEITTAHIIGKGLASMAICAAGSYWMYLTNEGGDLSGIGWIIFGLFIIWGLKYV